MTRIFFDWILVGKNEKRSNTCSHYHVDFRCQYEILHQESSPDIKLLLAVVDDDQHH